MMLDAYAVIRLCSAIDGMRLEPRQHKLLSQPHLILHVKTQAVLGLALASVIEPGRGDIRMAEPFLHFRDIRLMRERICRSCRAHRVHTKSIHFSVDTGFATIFYDAPITEDELLELEISEDRHLRRLGIDPGQDPFTILLQLKKLRDARKGKS